MTTQYTPTLKLALPVQGELSGSWGDVVNDNITSMVEQAVTGLATIDSWTANSHTLTTANGTTSESRCAILELTDTGTALTGAGTVICPDASKLYTVRNSTGQIITVKTASGSGIAIPDGHTAFLYCDATNVVESITSFAGDVTVGGSTLTAATASTGGLVQVKSSKDGTWTAGEILGTFGVYTADGSSSGAGLAGKMDVVASLSGSGSFNDVVFYSRDGTGLNEAMRLDYLKNATFAGDVNTKQLQTRFDSSDTTLTGGFPTNDTLELLNETDVTGNYTSIGFTGNSGETTARIASVAGSSNGRGNLEFYIKRTSDGGAVKALELEESAGNATFGGDIIVDTGANAASITINSPSQVWSGGENLGELNWYTEDTSGAGPANVAGIKVTSAGTNALPVTSMVFQTSNANATPATALTLDGVQNATFAKDVTLSGGAVNFWGVRSNTAGSAPYATHVSGGGTWKFRVATSGSYLNWDWNNVNVSRMLITGDWQNTNNSYGAISDRNLKQDITDARSQWDDIKAIQLRNFRYIDEVQADENAKEHLGVIAQEVQEVSAGLVTQSDEEEHLGVNYMLLCVKAVGALQEAMTKIEDLEARVATLESAE